MYGVRVAGHYSAKTCEDKQCGSQADKCVLYEVHFMILSVRVSLVSTSHIHLTVKALTRASDITNYYCIVIIKIFKNMNTVKRCC